MNRKFWKIGVILVAAFFCCTIIACSDDDEPETTTETEPDPDEDSEDEPEPIGTIFTVDSIISYYVTSSTTDDLTCDVTSSSPKYSGDIVIPSSIEYNNFTYSVTGIGYLAFYQCENLTSVTVPNSVTTIRNYAFAWSRALTDVPLTNYITSIGEYAFYECTALTSVTISNSVTTIGNSAFRYCDKLTDVTIGSSVETIGEYAFASCTNLIEIYSTNPTPPTIESTTFDEVDKTACSLYVPIGSMEAYSSSDYWDEFSNIEEK